MNLLKTIFGIANAVDEVGEIVASVGGERIPERSKVEKHLSRFRRAIAQNSNPAKLDELRANLAYWEAIAAAQALVQPE
jgi:hypothetical protein